MNDNIHNTTQRTGQINLKFHLLLCLSQIILKAINHQGLQACSKFSNTKIIFSRVVVCIPTISCKQENNNYDKNKNRGHLKFCWPDQVKHQCISINQLMLYRKTPPSTTKTIFVCKVLCLELISLLIHQTYYFIVMRQVIFAKLRWQTLLKKSLHENCQIALQFSVYPIGHDNRKLCPRL